MVAGVGRVVKIDSGAGWDKIFSDYVVRIGAFIY